MRTLFALATIVALAPSAGLQAQIVLGFGAGIRSSSISLDPDDGDFLQDSRSGVSFGGFVGIPISETFRIQPGLNYAQKGAADTEDGVDVALELDYVEVPILGVFSVPSDGPVGLHLFGGPVLGFEVGCTLSGEQGGVSVDFDCDADDAGIDTKSFDLGVALGAAVSYATSETMSLFVSGQYGIGLTNIADDPDGESDDTAKNRSFGVNVGVAFRLGG